jgi:hypothetical protein
MAQLLSHRIDVGELCNDYGDIRLSKAQKVIGALDQGILPEFCDVFEQWVTNDEWLLLEGTHFETQEKRRIGVKCSKRGNSVYNRRLDRRLGFLSKIKNVSLFSLEDFKPNRKVESQLFWFTLSWDPSLFSFDDSWRNQVSYHWNLWITRMRNHYGRIQVLKFVQATPGSGLAHGFPHIHGVLLFQDKKFQIEPHIDKGDLNELSFRMVWRERKAVERAGGWHSFIDVKALKSVSSAVNYCRKYGQGTFDVVSDSGEVNEEALLNCAMNWYYRKRSFSVSGGLQRALSDLIRLLRNSKVFQGTLDGSPAIPVWSWEFLGVRSMRDLEICGLDPPGGNIDFGGSGVWDRLVRREYYRERWRID